MLLIQKDRIPLHTLRDILCRRAEQSDSSFPLTIFLTWISKFLSLTCPRGLRIRCRQLKLRPCKSTAPFALVFGMNKPGPTAERFGVMQKEKRENIYIFKAIIFPHRHTKNRFLSSRWTWGKERSHFSGTRHVADLPSWHGGSRLSICNWGPALPSLIGLRRVTTL